MNINRTIIITTLVLLVFIGSTKVAASDIYHWVDDNGVSHYSQYQPDGDTQNVSKQQLKNKPQPANGDAEDVYNVEAHEKHMAEWREERDEKRADARAHNSQTAQQHSTRNPKSYSAQSGSYWYPPVYGKPPVKPRPPIVRPRPSPGLRR